MRPEQVLDGVVAEEGGEDNRDGGQSRGVRGHGRGHAVCSEAGAQRMGEAGGEAEDHEREEHADRDDLGRVLEGLVHAAARAAVPAGEAVHDCRSVGGGEHAHRDAVEGEDEREQRIGEVDREEDEQAEAERGAEHPAAGEAPGPEAV